MLFSYFHSFSFSLAHSNLPPRSLTGRLSNKADAGKAYDFNEQKDERIYESLSSFRKRRLADKKYEFSEEDTEDSENIVPFRLSKPIDTSILPSPAHPLPPSPLLYAPKDRTTNKSTSSVSFNHTSLLHFSGYATSLWLC